MCASPAVLKTARQAMIVEGREAYASAMEHASEEMTNSAGDSQLSKGKSNSVLDAITHSLAVAGAAPAGSGRAPSLWTLKVGVLSFARCAGWTGRRAAFQARNIFEFAIL